MPNQQQQQPTLESAQKIIPWKVEWKKNLLHLRKTKRTWCQEGDEGDGGSFKQEKQAHASLVYHSLKFFSLMLKKNKGGIALKLIHSLFSFLASAKHLEDKRRVSFLLLQALSLTNEDIGKIYT